MSWFLRVVERPDGGWICRLGMEDFDQHVDIEGALTHIRVLALDYEPSEIFIHHADGRVIREIQAGDP